MDPLFTKPRLKLTTPTQPKPRETPATGVSALPTTPLERKPPPKPSTTTPGVTPTTPGAPPPTAPRAEAPAPKPKPVAKPRFREKPEPEVRGPRRRTTPEPPPKPPRIQDWSDRVGQDSYVPSGRPGAGASERISYPYKIEAGGIATVEDYANNKQYSVDLNKLDVASNLKIGGQPFKMRPEDQGKTVKQAFLDQGGTPNDFNTGLNQTFGAELWRKMHPDEPETAPATPAAPEPGTAARPATPFAKPEPEPAAPAAQPEVPVEPRVVGATAWNPENSPQMKRFRENPGVPRWLMVSFGGSDIPNQVSVDEASAFLHIFKQGGMDYFDVQDASVQTAIPKLEQYIKEKNEETAATQEREANFEFRGWSTRATPDRPNASPLARLLGADALGLPENFSSEDLRKASPEVFQKVVNYQRTREGYTPAQKKVTRWLFPHLNNIARSAESLTPDSPLYLSLIHI